MSKGLTKSRRPVIVQRKHEPKHIQVEWVERASLKPSKQNSRKHSPEQVDQLVSSLNEFGWTRPIMCDDAGNVIAGHGILQAATKRGDSKVPVIRLSGMDDAQRRAYMIADNKLALNSGWDMDILAQELSALQDMSFDLGLTGFTDIEIGSVLAKFTAGNSDPDEIPDVQERVIAEPGDVWILGRHRLVCGDSTDADVVAKALNGISPHLMVTDPPYGVEYDASWRTKAGLQKTGAHGKVKNDDRADWREAWALFPGDVAYVWHAGVAAVQVAESLEVSGFTIRSQIVWAKNTFAISRGDYHWQHEPCWYAVKKGKTGHWSGNRKQTTLWEIDKPRKSDTGHSTQKPVECMKRPIENNSSPGQAVYEPFSGSGTTIIAAEMTGRSCHAIELNPAYIDVAIRRWQDFTGEQAILEGTKATFEEKEKEGSKPAAPAKQEAKLNGDSETSRGAVKRNGVKRKSAKQSDETKEP